MLPGRLSGRPRRRQRLRLFFWVCRLTVFPVLWFSSLRCLLLFAVSEAKVSFRCLLGATRESQRRNQHNNHHLALLKQTKTKIKNGQLSRRLLISPLGRGGIFKPVKNEECCEDRPVKSMQSPSLDLLESQKKEGGCCCGCDFHLEKYKKWPILLESSGSSGFSRSEPIGSPLLSFWDALFGGLPAGWRLLGLLVVLECVLQPQSQPSWYTTK